MLFDAWLHDILISAKLVQSDVSALTQIRRRSRPRLISVSMAFMALPVLQASTHDLASSSLLAASSS